jgi:phytanoyl-CoA hydroxylase
MIPDASQQARFRSHGYYIARSLLTGEEIAAIRSALLRRAEEVARTGDYFSDKLLEGASQGDPEALPLHERFRKLNGLDLVPELWNHWYAGPAVLAHVRAVLGDDILKKYASAFLKPARIGGPTPWHQDIGLWRDRNDGAFSGWLAVDAATRANGCLQFVPGTHLGPVIEHVVYEDSVHGELPRELCRDLPVEHIELAPGDAVFWQSRTWHFSPPNRSEHGRIGVGAVWINPAQISELRAVNRLRWALRQGEPVLHPAPELIVDSSVEVPIVQPAGTY